MAPIDRLISLILVAVSVAADFVPPASFGVPYSSDNVLNPNGSLTDVSTILSTIGAVNQKSGAAADIPPNQPVPETTVTANDGQLLNAAVSSVTNSTTTRRSLQKRQSPSYLDKYQQVFAGTGPPGLAGVTDAAIEGTAYLTYTLVSNATYNVDDCLSFCDRVDGCVFVNLYYEFNNYLLDFVFSEHSNLKCAAFGDIHTASEKTNAGGQQSYLTYTEPFPLTYMQDSSGWAAKSLTDPSNPPGYDLVFGPTGGANNAPGYMGFSFIDRYDVNACAQLCNSRGADSNGGACQYFNIWRAVVSGVPTTYTCSFYYIPANASTAVNYGQGNLQVTYSRGYRRTSLLLDGGFEDIDCGNYPQCFIFETDAWTSVDLTPQGYEASVFKWSIYAHSGLGGALFGSATAASDHPGTIISNHALPTVVGQKYTISLFANNAYNGPNLEQAAFLQVLWNGVQVGEIRGYSPWTYYQFSVTGVQEGGDHLSFHGGASPAFTFIDDVYVFAA